jgi:hypothetical protein
VPGALVFVPDGAIYAFPGTVTCDQCARPPPSITSVRSGIDGKFQLDGVPDGNVTVVIQLGRFRRVLHLTLDPCGVMKLPPALSRLPRRTGEQDANDHVPRIAVATGDYDQIECVLQRMGIAAVDLFNDRNGVMMPPTISTLDALFGDPNKLALYDLVVVNCTENEFDSAVQQPSVQKNLTQYAASGGRLFLTDWAYDVAEQVPAFAPYLCFEPQRGGNLMCGAAPQTLMSADSNSPYSNDADILDPDLAKWLSLFPNVIDKNGRVPVSFSFVVVDAVAQDAKTYPTRTWVNGDTGGFGVKPMTVTFDYNRCGRVHYSTYNTEPNGVVPDNERYPNCKPTFSPQERILEYLVFETTNCIGGITHM